MAVRPLGEGVGPVTSTPCPFCEIAEERAPAQVIRRWVDAMAIAPLNPVTEGHTLVLPYTHVSDAAMHPVLTGQVMQRAAELAGLTRSANIITSIGAEATQTVMHLHVHVVPRRPNDGLALPWTGQTL